MSAGARTRWVTLPVVITIVLGLVLSATAAVTFGNRERAVRQTELRSEGEQLRARLQGQIDRRVATLRLLRDSVESRWPIDRLAFHEMVAVDEPGAPFGDVEAVSFDRRLDEEDRQAFEAVVRADRSLDPRGYPDFRITPPTSEVDELMVVEYLEPLVGNENAFGFDIASNPSRREAILRARDTGLTVATEPLQLVQTDGDEGRGLLLISPVYDTTELLVSGPSRRRHFVGVVVVVLSFGALLGPSAAPDPNLDVRIYDQGPALEPLDEPVFTAQNLVLDADRGPGVVVADGALAAGAERLDLTVGGRRWSLLVALRTPAPVTGPILAALIGLLATTVVAGALALLNLARRRAEALAESRTADLRQVIDSAPDPTLVIGPDGRIVLASSQVRDMLGHESDELVGQPVEVLVPVESVPRHEDLRDAFAPTIESRRMGRGEPLQARHADGSLVDVDISIAALPETTTMGAVVVSLRDVSVQRRAMAELRAADEMKTTFLSTVSHELRTPLTAIRGFAHLLQRRTEQPPDAAAFIDRIVTNSEALRSLIEEMLDFARLQEGAIEVHPEQGDLSLVVSEALEELEPLTERHDVQPQLSTTPVHVDPGVVQRVVRNLITNAVRYAPEGTPIHVLVEQRGDRAVLVVDDHGPGIPPEERPRVFETFWRGDVARQTSVQGTGVGLAVVAQLVELSAGTVLVDANPDGGARLVVTFPTTASRRNADPAGDDPPPGEDQAAAPVTARPSRPSPYSSMETT